MLAALSDRGTYHDTIPCHLQAITSRLNKRDQSIHFDELAATKRHYRNASDRASKLVAAAQKLADARTAIGALMSVMVQGEQAKDPETGEYNGPDKIKALYERARDNKLILYVELDEYTLTRTVENPVDKGVRTMADYMAVNDESHPSNLVVLTRGKHTGQTGKAVEEIGDTSEQLVFVKKGSKDALIFDVFNDSSAEKCVPMVTACGKGVVLSSRKPKRFLRSSSTADRQTRPLMYHLELGDVSEALSVRFDGTLLYLVRPGCANSKKEQDIPCFNKHWSQEERDTYFKLEGAVAGSSGHRYLHTVGEDVVVSDHGLSCFLVLNDDGTLSARQDKSLVIGFGRFRAFKKYDQNSSYKVVLDSGEVISAGGSELQTQRQVILSYAQDFARVYDPDREIDDAIDCDGRWTSGTLLGSCPDIDVYGQNLMLTQIRFFCLPFLGRRLKAPRSEMEWALGIEQCVCEGIRTPRSAVV